MDQVVLGSIELKWDAAARLAVLSFTQETSARGPEAAAMVDAMKGWVGTGGAPFALLGDGGKLKSVDAEYRAVWGDFFRAHREDSFIAFFNMGVVIRIAADMFRIGTGVRLRAFATESDARAWLREQGIAA